MTRLAALARRAAAAAVALHAHTPWARASLPAPAAVPEGFVLVPRGITPAIEDALNWIEVDRAHHTPQSAWDWLLKAALTASETSQPKASCKTCGGSGRLSYWVGEGGPGGHPEEIDCPDCT